MDIEWSDPPEKARLSGNPMVEFIAELRKRPGVWGKYPYTYKSTSNISMYRRKHPDVEFQTHKIGAEQVEVWGRIKKGKR